KSAVHPKVSPTDMVETGHHIALERHNMEALCWPDTKETRGHVTVEKVAQVLRQGQVGYPVGIIGEKHFLIFQIRLNSREALANVGMDTSVNEGNTPVIDISIEKVEFLAAFRQDKIVR